MPKLSQEEIHELIVHSARESNILPITSRCDAGCIFCSHKNNPPEVLVASVGTRSIEDIVKTFPFLRKDVEITIGESATRLIEGEPMLHPDFLEIIKLLRQFFPRTPISITTNGHYLTEETVSALADAGNVLINLSLNSASMEGRRLLMGDSPEVSRRTLEGVKLLKEYKIPFHGSLVGMPNVTGYEDIKNTVEFLANNGALSVRVFAPGFSQYVKEDLFPNADTIIEELRAFIGQLSEDLPCPVLLEPSNVKDLRAICSGVVKGSAAWEIGMRRGDEIITIDGKAPRSRVEAFEMLECPGSHEIQFFHQGELRSGTITWNRINGSGITMEFDFDMRRGENIRHAVMTAPGHVLALTSEFAYPVFCAMLEKLKVPKDRIDARFVPNITFGGTIKAAGLLSVADYLAAFEAYCGEKGRPGAVMLPRESFDFKGRDLTGRTFSELQKSFNLPTILI
ncbi:MAG: DUF512 domain-containing protein [Oscillospiraceae bacterium]|jgi:MoaA/NifB/PqqE/SkfB family radical SAM enzyme